MPSTQVTARVGIGMTTLLTLVTMYANVRQNTPEVSYITFLDIWMLFCLIFVISCMFEFILVLFFNKLEKEIVSERFEIICRIVFALFFFFALIFWTMLILSN